VGAFGVGAGRIFFGAPPLGGWRTRHDPLPWGNGCFCSSVRAGDDLRQTMREEGLPLHGFPGRPPARGEAQVQFVALSLTPALSRWEREPRQPASTATAMRSIAASPGSRFSLSQRERAVATWPDARPATVAQISNLLYRRASSLRAASGSSVSGCPRRPPIGNLRYEVCGHCPTVVEKAGVRESATNSGCELAPENGNLRKAERTKVWTAVTRKISARAP